MTYIKGVFAILWSTLMALCSTIPTRVSYPWDGTPASQGDHAAYVDFWAGEQEVASGNHITNSGWIDFRNVGRPFCQAVIKALGTGAREVEIVIEYARRSGSQKIVITGRDRLTNVANIDYFPKTLLWMIPLKTRIIGNFARVKWIYNKGDMNINVQCLAPSSGQPCDIDEELVVDVEVVENV